ncbi:MAG: hypothetical protein WBE79_15375 [Candidatus Cybelea sp.]
MTHARIVAVTVRRTPAPVAISTPRPMVRSRSVVAVQRLLIARAYKGRPGGGPQHRAAPIALPARVAYDSRPVWDVGGASAGSGPALSSSGAGAGTGARGRGNGAINADEPCGFVTFSNPHGSHYDPSTHGFWVDIRMAVHFSNGSSQSLMLDYPWYYSNEAANPWSDQNLKDPSFPTRFQAPPSGKTPGEPPLVQYVIAHSTPDGMTLLHDCPDTSPTPAT